MLDTFLAGGEVPLKQFTGIIFLDLKLKGQFKEIENIQVSLIPRGMFPPESQVFKLKFEKLSEILIIKNILTLWSVAQVGSNNEII